MGGSSPPRWQEGCLFHNHPPHSYWSPINPERSSSNRSDKSEVRAKYSAPSPVVLPVLASDGNSRSTIEVSSPSVLAKRRVLRGASPRCLYGQHSLVNEDDLEMHGPHVDDRL